VVAVTKQMFETRSDGLVYHENLDRDAPSGAHGATGQNILSKSGHVAWSSRPVLTNGDNIWLLEGVDRYVGTERPARDGDSFLVP